MKKLLMVLCIVFAVSSCSKSEPCSFKEGLTVRGCKEKGKNAAKIVKENFEELKEKVK